MTATNTLQKAKFILNSENINLENAYLRFVNYFNEGTAGDIFIANVLFYEEDMLVSLNESFRYAGKHFDLSSGITINDFKQKINSTVKSLANPKTGEIADTIELKKIDPYSIAATEELCLTVNTTYILEFEYWSDAEVDTLITDLFPDDLPETWLNATRAVQKAKIEISSTNINMENAYLRFVSWGNNRGNVYFANVVFYEKNALSTVLEYSNPWRYAGEYLDLGSGNYYLRNRYYNPKIGRFLTEDPIRDGTNWYTYASNNPVLFMDPSGLERIVTSGGVYKESKQDSGDFYYEFIEPAIKQLKTYYEDANNETVTWIIADAGWSDIDKDNFARSTEVNFTTGVKIKYISSSNELIDYINNKDDGNRSEDKITHISFFSHGLNNNIPLGFNYAKRNTDLDFTQEQIAFLDSNSFDNVYAQFYSCNTGTGEYSFAQSWVDQVKGTALALGAQTVYTGINENQPLRFKTSRYFNGFSLFGSANLPVATSGAEFKIFTPSK